MDPRPLHIFTAIHAEAKAIRRILPANCELHVVGIRAVHLPKNLTPCRGILMAGFGGALDPVLKIGDIVIDDPPGRIHTAAGIVSTVAEKAELFRTTGSQIVDMENAIVRSYARQMGVPFMGMRAVSDRADESLDPAVLASVDDMGRPIALKLAVGLLKRPTLISSLHRLAIHSKLAATNLAQAVATCRFANS